MGGAGGMDFGAGEDENMDFAESAPKASASQSSTSTSSKPEPAQDKPDSKANLTEEQRKSES